MNANTHGKDCKEMMNLKLGNSTLVLKPIFRFKKSILVNHITLICQFVYKHRGELLTS